MEDNPITELNISEELGTVVPHAGNLGGVRRVTGVSTVTMLSLLKSGGNKEKGDSKDKSYHIKIDT